MKVALCLFSFETRIASAPGDFYLRVLNPLIERGGFRKVALFVNFKNAVASLLPELSNFTSLSLNLFFERGRSPPAREIQSSYRLYGCV